MVPLLIIPGRYDVISKKFEKWVFLKLLAFECFFRNINMLIVIIEHALKWWVTWPFLRFDLENDQFDHYKKIFDNFRFDDTSTMKEIILQEVQHMLQIVYLSFSVSFMTVRDKEMFLAISCDFYRKTIKTVASLWAIREYIAFLYKNAGIMTKISVFRTDLQWEFAIFFGCLHW